MVYKELKCKIDGSRVKMVAKRCIWHLLASARDRTDASCGAATSCPESYSVVKERPGRKKVVPPLRGRRGEDDEVGNEDLPGFSTVWVLETKFVEFFGANLGPILGDRQLC